MGLRKQAKVLTAHQQRMMMSFLDETRYAERNKLIFMFSIRAGLRAKEIACITWDMVTDSNGEISDCIRLQNKASKGQSGGVVWLNKELRMMLEDYWSRLEKASVNERIIKSERGKDVTAVFIVNLFYKWYRKMGYVGCSSHSGRRTFITNAAKKISSVGGSIRDVQALARHSSLQMTQRYIDEDVDAQKKVVQIV